MTMTNVLNRNLVGAFGAVLLGVAFVGAATAPANAATAPVASKVVYYGDLNLASQAGRTTYETRVRGAAKAVCNVGSTDLASATEEARCVKAAINSAKLASN